MKRNLSIYRQIVTVLQQYPKLVATLLITSFFGVFAEGLGLGLILPLLQPTLAGDWLEQIPLLAAQVAWLQNLTLIQRVQLAVLILVGVVLVRNLFVVATRFAALKLQEQIEYDLKMNVFRQLHVLELRYIHHQQIGGMFTTLTQHTWQATWMMNYVTGAVADGFALLVYTSLMLLVSWQLTLIAAALLITILLLNNWLFLGWLRRLGKSEVGTDRHIRSFALESLSAMKLLHLFRKEEARVEDFDQSLRDNQQAVYGGKRLTAILMPIFRNRNLITCAYQLGGTQESATHQRATYLPLIP